MTDIAAAANSSPDRMDIAATSPMPSLRPLSGKWAVWAHLPQDPDWSIASYIKIAAVASVEQAATLMHAIPPNVVENCMLFVMRDGIKPTWEDPRNRLGGCFSYKISNKVVNTVWRSLYYSLVGGTLTPSARFMRDVTGITISPKRNFCIIKVWLASCDHQDPTVIDRDTSGLSPDGCLFKKHAPEY